MKANGDRITSNGKEGDSLLDVIVNNNLDFDGFGKKSIFIKNVSNVNYKSCFFK